MIEQAVNSGLVTEYQGPVAEIVEVRNALVHGRRKFVDDEALLRVGDWCRNAVSQLQEQQLPEQPSHDVSSLLDYFHRTNPGAPHTQVADGLRNLDYTPNVSGAHHYIRWHLSTSAGSVTLYQNKKGVVLDSRAHSTHGRTLAGAQVQGRRVLFYYTHASAQQILLAAAALRRRIHPDTAE